MKKLVPQNDVVVCSCKTKKEKTTTKGLIYTVEEVPLYKVESIGPRASSNSLELSIGDIIMVNSTGTVVEVDSKEYFMFKIENIVGKVN